MSLDSNFPLAPYFYLLLLGDITANTDFLLLAQQLRDRPDLLDQTQRAKLAHPEDGCAD